SDVSDRAVLTHLIGFNVGKSGTQSATVFRSIASKDKALTRLLTVDTTEFVLEALPSKICGLIAHDVATKETMAESSIARKKRFILCWHINRRCHMFLRVNNLKRHIKKII